MHEKMMGGGLGVKAVRQLKARRSRHVGIRSRRRGVPCLPGRSVTPQKTRHGKQGRIHFKCNLSVGGRADDHAPETKTKFVHGIQLGCCMFCQFRLPLPCTLSDPHNATKSYFQIHVQLFVSSDTTHSFVLVLHNY